MHNHTSLLEQSSGHDIIPQDLPCLTLFHTGRWGIILFSFCRMANGPQTSLGGGGVAKLSLNSTQLQLKLRLRLTLIPISPKDNS